ncbi:MAG: cyclopropane-fatty-acyl-phospholipid synthase family protein [Acidobacteriia bacterium]|nr:cyclopropane-fatty-acyl-phospholipid synthase family protein [Terriglobia bacterium]
MTTPTFSSIEKWILQRIHATIGRPPIRLALGRGPELLPAGIEPLASVLISDWRTLARLAFNPEIGFGDGYSEGCIEVEGDLVLLMETVLRCMKDAETKGWYPAFVSRWLERVQANTLNGSARNIHHHYDLTADFYKLWLDPQLVYTCAYFPTPSATLEQAQLAKMDYICQKLHLRSGEKIVEAGCGWGALALHMAKNYRVTVRAFNISREQILFARERAKREGLTHQVEFIEDDYRNISGHSDVFISVGMLEHVGAEHYNPLGHIIHRTIGDSGRGLLHFIGRNQESPFSPWIRKRIFPGAYVPTLGQVMDIFEPWDFSVQDVENLRYHYAKTLEHWLSRFESSVNSISRMFGAEFVRAWRLYLAGSIAAFRVGRLQLFQILFAGSNCQRVPWTRNYLYGDQQSLSKESRWTHAMS